MKKLLENTIDYLQVVKQVRASTCDEITDATTNGFKMIATWLKVLLK